jgi:hypothetical protein
MSKEKLATFRNRTFGKNFNFAAAAAVMILMLFAAGSAIAGTASANNGTSPQNVNVVNTPTVNVGNTPSVSVVNTPTVNVANTPAVSISGTPTVNANATITAPGPLTNVGRLPSQQVTLEWSPGYCATNLMLFSGDGNSSCFDISNYPGQVLVITDVAWWASGTAGETCLSSLQGTVGRFLFSPAPTVADGSASKSDHLTAGARMTINPIALSSCTLQIFEMQGYLVPNN